MEEDWLVGGLHLEEDWPVEGSGLTVLERILEVVDSLLSDLGHI